MASLFRNITTHFTGVNDKATDVQLARAFEQFESERAKLAKFQREFNRYAEAILTFDNAAYRFFDAVQSLENSGLKEPHLLVQSCLDIGRIRGEHLQNLNKQITANLDLSMKKFEEMRANIEVQRRLQHEYGKARQKFQSSTKNEDSVKIDHLRNEVDQSKSVLNLRNQELRESLPTFHREIHNEHVRTITDLFDIHGKYHKSFYKTCSYFVKQTEGKRLKTSNKNGSHGATQENASTESDPGEQNRNHSPLSQPKDSNHRILYEALVRHDYTAENADELDLVKGELIVVLAYENADNEERDEGWEYAKKADGTIGLFPINFIVRVYDNERQTESPNGIASYLVEQ